MRPSPYDDLKGSHVHFRVRDVRLPEPAEVLDELHGGDLLEGKVVDLSDNGTEGGVYVVVEVDGVQRPLVVAADRVLRTT